MKLILFEGVAEILQYLLANAKVCYVIPGFRNLRQAEVSLSTWDKPLSAEDVAFIREPFTN